MTVADLYRRQFQNPSTCSLAGGHRSERYRDAQIQRDQQLQYFQIARLSLPRCCRSPNRHDVCSFPHATPISDLQPPGT